MATSKANKHNSKLNIIGHEIGGIICSRFILFGDAVLVLDENKNQKLFYRDSINQKPKEYKIDGSKVIHVAFTEELNLFILETSKRQYFRDKLNQEIQGSEAWTDYYLDPFSSTFFRKDEREDWYDIQGYQLKTLFLIKDQILFSLSGKTCKKSLFYRNQSLYVNPKCTIAQVGKVVYDINLKILYYFGDKITGLGHTNIRFDNSSSLQEVYLGLVKRGFINEDTYEPYTINGEEINNHIGTRKVGKFTFEVFQSYDNEFVVYNDYNNILTHEKKYLSVDFESLITLGNYHIIKVKSLDSEFYYDLESNKPFDPFDNKELVIEVDFEPVKKGMLLLYNMVFENHKLVYSSTEDIAFSIGDNREKPDRVDCVSGFENYFYYATFEDHRKLCSKKTNEIIKVEDGAFEIGSILSDSNQKLLNILTPDGKKLALDARHGLDNLEMTKVGAFRIKETIGTPHSLGNTILQNVRLETLGGTKNRVINLNDAELKIYCLPSDLKAYSEQSEPSIFANNVITEIDFENKIHIDGIAFFNATFINYINENNRVVIQEENAKPMQLDGLGHRNEIVQFFDSSTLKNKYFLSKHRIIGVNTLTEDLKINQLLFSFKIMSSWLPFFETYLPIFKKITDFEDAKNWKYHLFEIHNISNDREYIAVEKKPPFRILVDKTKSKYRTRIVKSKEIILRSPEEISAIQRFFSNPGHLIDIP